jgi:hypothetical protein
MTVQGRSRIAPAISASMVRSSGACETILLG